MDDELFDKDDDLDCLLYEAVEEAGRSTSSKSGCFSFFVLS